MIAPDKLLSAYDRVCRDLLAERNEAGHWTGELASSALSTATAVSALAVVRRERLRKDTGLNPQSSKDELAPFIKGGLRWLLRRQNEDGGWGDTDISLSNIACTMLVDAAFSLAGVARQHPETITRAREYVNQQGGIPSLRRRYGKDKTFAVPILTNAALAGQVGWKEVPALPFEMACLPQSMLGALQLPVVSYALPALIAIGLAKYHHAKPVFNLPLRWARAAATDKSLEVLTNIQPESGGFLEATPLTSFVVMSLAGSGRVSHPVTDRGVKFLLDSVRSDGSWPIDTNLATWNTTLSMNALALGGTPVHELGCLDWLLECQHREVHPYTGAAPGGWAWTDLSGGVPDADDTSGALISLSHWQQSAEANQVPNDPRIRESAGWGVSWLLNLQNRDGGWPTFCRGWGALPFDRSSNDITAHAIRALHMWRGKLAEPGLEHLPHFARFNARIDAAIAEGFRYLVRQQRTDGSWLPLWFGNQHHPAEENAVYGTSKVLLAYCDLDRLAEPEAVRGVTWFLANQNADGGWGGGPLRGSDKQDVTQIRSSVEETALAVESLLASKTDQNAITAADRGLAWLVETVSRKRHRECSPIGFYFAKLWYYEKLYPLIFAASALGRAVASLPEQHRKTSVTHLEFAHSFDT